jgi:hypothetical protein
MPENGAFRKPASTRVTCVMAVVLLLVLFALARWYSG